MARFGLIILMMSVFRVASEEECSPIYVRWPRVRLNLTSRVTGSYSLEDSAKACSKNEHPGRPGFPLQCSGFNHKHGANNLANDCQLFQKDQISNLDGNVEYDDRYSFYWKYCVKAKESCKSAYHYDFHIDRYMDYNESKRRILTFQVEDCLDQCLQEKSFECRSVSFNRTAGYCYLSEESRLSKPTSVRINSNPNYRIDYYENKCHNDCFTFHHECQQNGVMVSVESKFPYTGAMYGLYDFFSCRIEPKEETKFQYFFPFSSVSKNCSDSMSIRDGEYVLEVVLSTDNVVPLYFLTDEDLIYKAKCPTDGKAHYSASTIGAQVELVPPFSKSEAVSRLPADFSSTSTSTSFPASSSIANASVENTTIPAFAHENVTLSLEELRWNGTNTTEEGGLENKTTVLPGHEEKKPIDILNSLDPQPSDSKPEERKGNKITLFVRYPKEDNETLPMESNETRHYDHTETTTTSTQTTLTSGNSTSSTPRSTVRTRMEGEIELSGSGSGGWTERSSSSHVTGSTSTESTTKSTTEATTETTSSLTTSTSISTSSSSSTTTETSTSSSTSSTSTSPSTTIQTSTSPSPSTLTSTSTTESSTQSSTESTSTVSTTTEEDTELSEHSSQSPTSSTTIPTWVYAWRFQLVSSTTTAPPSLITDDSSLNQSSPRPWEPAHSIDTAVLGIDKPNDVDSSATSSPRSNFTVSTASSPTSSTSTTVTTIGSTGSTSQHTVSSTISATSATYSPFWPFVLRTRSSTIWRAYTEANTDNITTTTTTPTSTTTANGSIEANATTKSVSVSTTTWNGTETTQDTNQTNSTVGSTSSTTTSTPTTTTNKPNKKVQFDVHHNGQPVSAVVVGSRITLSFSPSLSLPGTHMSLVGCQVEPINSPYAWEREPLPIVKDGCHADGVGLVCPPSYTETGIKVEMEAFRYTTTGEVLYSCLVRVCPYGPCPQAVCGTVDGCNNVRRSPSLAISPTFPDSPIGFGRKKRQATTLPVLSFLPISADLQSNLVTLAGDHVVTKKLVVVNSDTELQYYLRTGNVPSPSNGASLNGFLGR